METICEMLFFAVSQSGIYCFCKLCARTGFTVDCSHHLECAHFAQSLCKWLFPVLLYLWSLLYCLLYIKFAKQSIQLFFEILFFLIFLWTWIIELRNIFIWLSNFSFVVFDYVTPVKIKPPWWRDKAVSLHLFSVPEKVCHSYEDNFK